MWFGLIETWFNILALKSEALYSECGFNMSFTKQFPNVVSQQHWEVKS